MGAAKLDPACPELQKLKTLHRDQTVLLSGPALAEAVRRRQQEDLARHERTCARCAAHAAAKPPEPAPPPPRPGRFAALRALFRRGRDPKPAAAPRAAPTPAGRTKPAAARKPAPAKPPAAKPAARPAAPKPVPPRPAPRAAQPPPKAEARPPQRRKPSRKDSVAAALQLLGLSPGASADAVRLAYRERAQLCHPDKVMHLSPSTRAMADATMKDVNRAYEVLKRAGMA